MLMRFPISGWPPGEHYLSEETHMSYGPQGGGNPYGSPQFDVKPNQGMPPGSVPNHLAWAIFCLICCGVIFAIPAIIYSTQVNPKLQAGDYAGAVEASNNAKKWCIIAMCAGLLCNALAIGLQIVVGVAQNS